MTRSCSGSAATRSSNRPCGRSFKPPITCARPGDCWIARWPDLATAAVAEPESASAMVVVPTQEPKPVASPAEVEPAERELSALRVKLQQTSDPESIARLQAQLFWKQRQ